MSLRNLTTPEARAWWRQLRFLGSAQWIIVTVLMAGLIPLFWHLSTWQFHRLDDRRASNSATAAAIGQPARDITSVLADSPSAEVADWTPVRVSGTWVEDSTQYARRQWRDDRMGFYVLTRLRNADGRQLAVVRGFTPASRAAAQTPSVVPPPSGSVKLRGWLRRAEPTDARSVPIGQVQAINNTAAGIAQDNAITTMWLLVDHSQTERRSIAVDEVESAAIAAHSQLLDVTPPAATEGPHQSYAWQWRAFAVLVIAGWLALVRAELRQRRAGESASGLRGD